MTEKTFHTKYNRPPRVVSPSGKVSLCDASALPDTDINTILKRYNAGDTSAIRSLGVFADVSNVGDFTQCMELVRKAREDFEALPSHLRERFGNDPTSLLKFLADSNNDNEAVKLGLKEVRKVEKSLSEQIVEGVTTAVAKGAPPPSSVAS